MRIRNWRHRLDEPEPTNKRGEILLSRNHVPLLQALLDRPHGMALSHAEWFRAALPYAAQMGTLPSGLLRGQHTIHHSWVNRMKIGSGLAVQLTERGHAILDRKLEAYVRYTGPYKGMADLRSRKPAR